jgi:serine/threonine protein phosphatase PrpC
LLLAVGTPFSAFGIFDGHGGKSAATFASKELLPTVAKLLDHCKTAGTVS